MALSTYHSHLFNNLPKTLYSVYFGMFFVADFVQKNIQKYCTEYSKSFIQILKITILISLFSDSLYLNLNNSDT